MTLAPLFVPSLILRQIKATWQATSFKLPEGAIVKGSVVQVLHDVAFVRMEHGPTAMLHGDALTSGCFKSMNGILQVGGEKRPRACRPLSPFHSSAPSSPLLRPFLSSAPYYPLLCLSPSSVLPCPLPS